MTHVLKTVVFAAVCLVIASQSHATGVQCAERDVIVSGLAKQYKEARQAIALTNKGGLLEVYASKAGTWSILVSTPSGKSCVVISGKDWLQKWDFTIPGNPS